MGLSHYVWNHAQNVNISQLYKKVNPKGVLLWGGPHIPNNLDKLKILSTKYKEVDFFISGMGEEIFLDILTSIQKFGTEATKRNFSKILYSTQQVLPSNNLPAPYLDGIFDSIFDKEMSIKASIETNRGCPYGCSFCDWGGQSSSKIINYDLETVFRSLEYLFQRSNIKEIEILDANFGMLKRDLQIVEFMIECKRKFHTNPNVSYSGLAKNGSPYLKKILFYLKNEFNINKRHLKLSFQSHNSNVLNIAGRSNIKSENLTNLLNETNSEVSSELILGLPGETSTSWADTLKKDIEIGIKYSRAYILSVSENTLLSDPTYQKKHSIKTKNVLFPLKLKNIERSKLLNLVINNSNTLEYENHSVLYKCFSFDIDELIKIYKIWWFHHNFYNSSGLYHFLQYFSYKIDYYEFCIDIIEILRSLPEINFLLQKLEEFVSTYYSEEEVTYIHRGDFYYFASGPMRFNDLSIILKLQDEIKTFIKEYIETNLSPDKTALNALSRDFSSWRNNISKNSLSHGLEAQLI